MKAKIFEIKRFAVHDGDGIRTTVFFKGCPLKCVWCHNPEGISAKSKLAYYAHKCISCGECLSVCPTSAHTIENGKHAFNREKCIACGRCVEACLGNALTLYGRETTVEELLPILLQDKEFYDHSDGGVTFSGGECMLQVDFLKAILEKCKENGMLFAYHNHDFEFVKVGDEYGLDVLYNTIPADLLVCQLDTCWVNVGGVNPSDYIRKYAGRMYTVHLKDFVGQKTDNMYGLIGLKEDDGSGVKVEEFDFRPVGYGVQNFPEILKASVDAGAQWVVVEQDRPSLGKTPLECAQMSVEYLHNL